MNRRRYKSREKAQSRYADENEQRAFRMAYARGYVGSSRIPAANEKASLRTYREYPNAWGAGYWEGFGARKD